ncbi:hypothetical protein [Sulfuriferula nivalis]|uniref:Uncharacterized protein n=1 Tax=Sulfuriferula nivalis TaxID=2675298 RepID=A0A809S7G6_9PROT|nr:hypothetical protein [Sulfuriferula nivalis]BBO99762.1 hypothetical protein SFSGTM_04710 [Sulfuriferula nivalis]
MSNDWQFRFEFAAVIAFSFFIPGMIYVVMMVKRSISRTTVALLGFALVAVAGIDAVLLHHIAYAAQHTASVWDDKLFASELSVALYLLPLVSAGVGVNILSHILITHLAEAERAFDRQANKEDV